MKNLKNIFLLAVVAISSGGCNKDLLTTVPDDRISTAIFWKSDKDAILASNAIYANMEDLYTWFYWDPMSDIGYFQYQYIDESLLLKGTYDASLVKIQTVWQKSYKCIQSANIFLDNVDKVNTIDPALILRLKGEVKVLRAYQYIRLAVLWGDVPLVTTETTLEVSRKLNKTPVGQIWDFVSKELTDAAALLPTTQTEKGRITKGAAMALKARALLYAGRYTDAATAASDVINLNIYSLYPSYKNLFSYAAENNSEVILDREYIKSSSSNDIFNLITPNSLWPGVSQFVPTKEAVDFFQMNNGKEITDPTSGFNPYDPYANRDPRLKYSIIVLGDVLPNGKIYNSKPNSGTGDAVFSSQNATWTGFNLKKYLNSEDLAQPTNCGINAILMRYAEVLLIYAEARIEANQIDQSVLSAINQVRARPDVNMPPITGVISQAELRNIVRHERVVELAFEGLRYFDIRRWRIAENVMPGIINGMTYTDNNGLLQKVSIPSFVKVFNKNRDYLWPIPQNEIYLDPNLLPQNPNW